LPQLQVKINVCVKAAAQGCAVSGPGKVKKESFKSLVFILHS